MSMTSTTAPPQLADLVDTAIAGKFATLVAAVKAAGLVDTLKGTGPFTVFAPTDQAFAKLPKAMMDDLLMEGNKAKLQAILEYHVVAGKMMAADVAKISSAKTVAGSDVAITSTGSTVKIDGATVTKSDIAASNGVIHVVDTVLLPK